jgi:cell division transport system permease protein
VKAWFAQHGNALRNAWRRLIAAPLNTLLSLLVIGIGLTLPAAGYILLDNLRIIGQGLSGSQQISVFLTLDAGRKDVAELESRLKDSKPGDWRFVSRDEALRRLQNIEGMADIVAGLSRNPLPDAFVIEPKDSSPEALERWRQTFAGWPKVAHVQLDSAWVRRFDAFLRLAKLAVTLLAGIFAAGLVAVTFNTIRLQVLANADEIEVARLIGATDGFIHRPFYYFGALQGGLGGLLAALLVKLGMGLLAGPASELSALYGGLFQLQGPNALHVLGLTLLGGLLGWLGAQISVTLSLRQIG